jgi:hypothetical protein
MRASDKRPETELLPDEQKQEASRRALWSFATRVRKGRLGPNRSILGED